MWLLYASLSAVFAALVAILGKLGLHGVDATLATTVRALVMAAFLVLVSLSLFKPHAASVSSWPAKDWLLIVLSGIAGALSWLCYFVALKQGATTAVVAVDRLSIVLVVLLAALFLGETLNWRSAVGSLLMVMGAILIAVK